VEMLVALTYQGTACVLKVLDGSGNFVSNHTHNPLKWFYPRQAVEYATANGMIVCEKTNVYQGLTIMKGSDNKFYIVNSSSNVVCIDYTFRTANHAMEIIDWHIDYAARVNK
jgi:hypothetical protein